jgi:hypothetical protein
VTTKPTQIFSARNSGRQIDQANFLTATTFRLTDKLDARSANYFSVWGIIFRKNGDKEFFKRFTKTILVTLDKSSFREQQRFDVGLKTKRSSTMQ